MRSTRVRDRRVHLPPTMPDSPSPQDSSQAAENPSTSRETTDNPPRTQESDNSEGDSEETVELSPETQKSNLELFKTRVNLDRIQENFKKKIAKEAQEAREAQRAKEADAAKRSCKLSTAPPRSLLPSGPVSASRVPSRSTGLQDLQPARGIRADSSSKQRETRGNLPKETTNRLKAWFVAHLQHPYPTEDAKQELMRQTNLRMGKHLQHFLASLASLTFPRSNQQLAHQCTPTKISN